MSSDQRALIERVASGFIEGTVVPILGAGCSANQLNRAGRNVEGFPLASQFARLVQQQYRYLQDAKDFYDVNVLVEKHEGPGKRINILTQAYSPPKSLPSYNALCRLPFDAAVSFNFDESFEKSLSDAGRAPFVVVSDEDVPLSRGATITVVKPHGTANRGRTLRATRKQVGDFETECPLVRSLLEVLLAQRNVLYVGYGFGDQDLISAVRRVRSWTRDSYHRSTAIVLQATAALRAELEEVHIDVIEGNAVEILEEIAAESIERKQIEPGDSERWRTHPFFHELVSIRGRPTETQVIEALLNATEERQNAVGVRVAVQQAADAARLCLTYRPNFGGLEHIERALEVIGNKESDEAAWIQWRDYREKRRATRRDIFDKASGFLRNVQRVLLYSQSQRVIEFLLDLEPRQRSRMRLVVPECRAKSPEPFQNSLLVAERLQEGGFEAIEFVADVVGFHLIVSGEIDVVLMGVHKAYKVRENADPIAIVNAVGAEAMCAAAEQANIQVGFMFEDEKFVCVESLDQARKTANFDPECDISVALNTNINRPTPITFRQIGYDFVAWRSNMLAFVGSLST